MKHKRTEAHGLRFSPAATKDCARILAALLAVGTAAISGCGGSSSSSKNVTPPATGTPVIVGTTKDSLPAIPAQSQNNKYVGADLISGVNWIFAVNQLKAIYNYQEEQGVANATSISGGTITPFADFEGLYDSVAATNGNTSPYGMNAEIPGGVSVFLPSPSTSSLSQIVTGVTQTRSGCLAPDGQVTFNFITSGFPPGPNYQPQTDAVLGSANLSFANGRFTYAGVAQSVVGGSAATTGMIPFADSYCIQALAGYGIQSTGSTDSNLGTGTVLTYIGDSGALVGAVNYTNPQPNAVSPFSSLGWAGFVQPSSPIDLSSVTSGTYKGFDYNRTTGDPEAAYFGAASQWLTTPSLTQGSGQLIGGSIDFYALEYNPTPTPVAANVLIDFGAQASSHPGAFPSAKFTKQDPQNLCSASQQSVGSDGLTYCTFPVAALVGETYGKNVIYISGPDPTATNVSSQPPTYYGLFYALVQE